MVIELAGIRERVKELGGTLDIISTDAGTMVTVRIPIVEPPRNALSSDSHSQMYSSFASEAFVTILARDRSQPIIEAMSPRSQLLFVIFVACTNGVAAQHSLAGTYRARYLDLAVQASTCARPAILWTLPPIFAPRMRPDSSFSRHLCYGRSQCDASRDGRIRILHAATEAFNRKNLDAYGQSSLYESRNLPSLR